MDFFTAMLLAGAAQGLFLAVVLQVRESIHSPSNSVLAALVACCAMTNLEDFAIQSGSYASFPWPAGFSLILLPLIGPLILLHVDSLTTRGSWRMERRHLWHLIVPAFCLLTLIPFWMLPAEQRYEILADKLSEPPLAAALGLLGVFLLTTVQIGVYVAAGYRLALKRENELDPATASRVRWLKVFLLIAALCWAGYAAAVVAPALSRDQAPSIGNWTGLLQVAGLYALGFLGLARPDSILPSAPDGDNLASLGRGEPVKYSRSALSEEDAGRIMNKIRAALQNGEIFLDPTLSLPKLAQTVGASTNDVSQAINMVAGCNYYAFINGYRVERAKELLAATEEPAIIDVAFAVGFNSKSVFNSAFKRSVGQTPSEWRLAQSRS